MVQKHRLPNTEYFRKSLSITNCGWISLTDLPRSHPNRSRTGWVMDNSLRTSQNRNFWSAPSVLPIAVSMSRPIYCNLNYPCTLGYKYRSSLQNIRTLPTLLHQQRVLYTKWYKFHSLVIFVVCCNPENTGTCRFWMQSQWYGNYLNTVSYSWKSDVCPKFRK
jgi:hypothetical protein